MALLLTYYSPTIPTSAGWSVDLVDPHFVRLGDFQGVVTEAELGAVGISSVSIDDPDGMAGHAADAIVGLKQMAITESSTPALKHRIWTGYIGQRQYRRGASNKSGSLITGPARVIDMDLVDINSFLAFRVFHLTDANRPAETDVARIAWLLGHSYLNTILFNNGLVSSANPVSMDASDFRGQKTTDVLNDCAQQSGKNFFVYYDETAGQFSLFYDSNDSLVYLADPVQVSNVLADVNLDAGDEPTGPIWPPSVDASLRRDPVRVVAGVYMPSGSNTAVYRSLSSTADTYGWRDAVAPAANLKTTALINARADRYLAENASEDDRLTFSLHLPAAHVNDWREGQAAKVRFTHLPGYESMRYVRCLKRQVAMKEPTDAYYDVQYECTPMLSSPSGAFSDQIDGVGFSGIPTLPRPTTPGNVLFALIFARGNTTEFPTQVRMLDNPPTSGSPPVPPYSVLQSAAWTVLATATTDYGGQNIGGPGGGWGGPYNGAAGTVTQGVLVAAAWRHVQPGEATVSPAAFSTELNHGATCVYLWELPTVVPPSGAFVSLDGHGSVPSAPALPTISGNVVAAFGYPLHGGHSTGFSGGNPTAGTATSPGTLLRQAWQSGVTGNPNKPDLITPNTMDFGQIILLPAGGIAAATLTPGVPGSAYTSLNWCGIAVELPAGVVLPDIPYPANQSA